MTKNTDILITVESKNKERLQKTILKRRQILIKTITRVEMLKVELEMTQQEYQARVGRLLLKSNQQDLDIIYYRNLLDLIEQGKTYLQAVKELEDTYYAQQRKYEEERQRLKEDEQIFNARAEEETPDFLEELKKLWKMLVSKFHPDLVTDPDEQKRREEVMKQINRAYEEHDLETLKKLEKDVHIDRIEESTVERLTEILQEIEDDIVEREEEYQQLRNSTWYHWKINIAKAKKRGEDIFADLERNLLDDIVKKIAQIELLIKQVEEKK
jgi:hypothetical protein